MIASSISLIATIGVFVAIIVLAFRFSVPKMKGKIGEGYVGKLLSRLPASEYTVFNNLLIPYGNLTSQIDHVVVSPYAVFVIETKNYKGWIYGGENSDHWTQNIWGNKYRMPNPIQQNAGHIRALQHFFKNNSISYVSIIAFSGRAYLKVNAPLCNVVYYGEILDIISKHTDVKLDSATVRQINLQLASIPKVTRKDEQQHIQKASEVVLKNRMSVSNGKCPKCGGQLVYRNGRYGSFYGCSNYPNCRYTLSR